MTDSINDEINILAKGSEDKWGKAALNLLRLGSEAVPHLIEAIRKNNYNSDRWNALGLEFIRFGLYKEPEKIFVELLKKEGEKNKGRNLNNLGISYLGLNKIEDAVKCFQDAYNFDIKQVGERKAKTLPAWSNLQRTLKKPLPIKQYRIKDKKGSGKLSKFQVLIYTEVLTGGLFAGALIYLLMSIEEYLPEIFGIKSGLFIAVVILVISLILMYILWRNITAKLHRIIDVKIITTSIQNQKHIVNADLYPNTRPKIIPIRKSTKPNQNVTKIINLKYSQVGFVSL